MIKNILVFCFWIGLSVVFAGCEKNHQDLVVSGLHCCNRVNPEGIDSPLLGWKLITDREGVAQSAWEIEIASSAGLLQQGNADIWKSGKQHSDEQFNIKPEGARFAEATGYFWRVRIWDEAEKVSSWSDPAYFSTGLLNESSWTAKWMTCPFNNETAMPCFRKVFSVAKEGVAPVKATVFFCGLGAGELWLNGQKVDSTRFLDPAQTNYEQYALYSTFDVTSRLIEGENCLGVMLGNGWFSQNIVASSDNPNLELLKEKINQALLQLRVRFIEINKILSEYVNLEYRRELKIDGIENHWTRGAELINEE
ncbi:MAG: hypothetical protein EOM73_12945, partial [Bacteroidia bacterium]|nr:hypothetical protein [Bacteroidia bacterium]